MEICEQFEVIVNALFLFHSVYDQQEYAWSELWSRVAVDFSIRRLLAAEFQTRYLCQIADYCRRQLLFIDTHSRWMMHSTGVGRVSTSSYIQSATGNSALMHQFIKITATKRGNRAASFRQWLRLRYGNISRYCVTDSIDVMRSQSWNDVITSCRPARVSLSSLSAADVQRRIMIGR